VEIVNLIVRKFRQMIKWVLAVVPLGRTITTSIGYRGAYKRNFGKIKFQGQFFQDMVAYLYLMNSGKWMGEGNENNRFFVDIGANDGLIGNNTYIFEQIGWKGICVEPQSDIFKHYLKRNRNCDCYNVALTSKSNENVEFFKAHGANALSGLNEGMSDAHKKWAEEYGKVEIINVKTMTFDEMMAKYSGIKHIDFMSIDVEGHEMKILKTIDFKKYSFSFLTIEKSEPENIKEYMKRNGYKVFMEIGADIMFIPENI
jgi:FkbM family methyltransferase